MKYTELVKELAKKYSLTLSLQEQTEKLSLNINKTPLILQATPSQNAFYIYLYVYKTTSHASASFYKKVLAANLFGHETSGHFIAYDPISDAIYLMEKIDEDSISFSSFEKKIHQILFAGSSLKEKMFVWEAESLQESGKKALESYPLQKLKA
jgi:hypothetical protein